MITTPEIRAKLEKLRLNEEDFVESFSRSSGPGGQNVNKVSTSVSLLHRPTGLRITIQDTRSQLTNRKIAALRLMDAIAEKRLEVKRAKIAAAAKLKRQRRPRPPALKKKILESKRHRGKLKEVRRGKFQLDLE